MKKVMIALIAAVCLAGLAYAADKPVEKTVTAQVNSQGVQSVEVLGGEYFFDPNHIIVKVNVPVELHVKKTKGFIPHDIVMESPEAGMKFKEAMSTEGAVIKFTPTKTGVYPFYCDKQLLFFETHRAKGMEGRIEVVQ